MASFKKKLNPLFPEKEPSKWHYGILYLFLALWMQGEAFLNILWPLLLLISIPYISYAFESIKPHRWLWVSVAVYLGARLLSLTFAMDTKLALYGITDDLRIFTIGLLLLSLIRTGEQLKYSMMATLGGFGVLAWHVLLQHWLTTHSFAPTSNIEFGSLADVNYAAAFTSVVLFSLLIASRHVPIRWQAAIALVAVPLCVMLTPLGSRTAILLLATAIAGYLILKRPSWIATGLILSSVILTFSVLSQTNSLGQFKAVENPLERSTIYNRIDIWKTLFHVWKEHPLGIGPRNFASINLNQYREWIQQNIPLTARDLYGEKAMNNGLKEINLNEINHYVSDPHNHYVALLAESGPIALLAFLSFLLAASVTAICHSFSRSSWTSGFGEAATGGLFLMSGSAIMASVFYQSGGVITIILIGFLLASISIHGTEQKREIGEN